MYFSKFPIFTLVSLFLGSYILPYYSWSFFMNFIPTAIAQSMMKLSMWSLIFVMLWWWWIWVMKNCIFSFLMDCAITVGITSILTILLTVLRSVFFVNKKVLKFPNSWGTNLRVLMDKTHIMLAAELINLCKIENWNIESRLNLYHTLRRTNKFIE